MYPQNEGGGNEARSNESPSYHFEHPVRYSLLAGVLAAVVAGSLELLLLDRPMDTVLKDAIVTGATWFVVLFGVLWYVRLKHEPRR